MKVLLVNGSPHEKGCTNMALNIVGEALEKRESRQRYSGLEISPLQAVLAAATAEKRENADMKTG